MARFLTQLVGVGVVGVLALASAAAAAPRLIHDASLEPPPPSVSPPERRALIDLYLARGLTVCPDFQVLFRGSGRFTADQNQTFYLVSNCYTDTASNLYRQRLAGDALILKGQTPVYFKAGFADDVAVLPALGGSRLNAVLAKIWQGPTQGYFWNNAEIMRFVDGSFKTLVNLGPTYADKSTPGRLSTSSRRTLWFDTAKPNLLRMLEFTSPQCDNCPDATRPYEPARAKQSLNVLLDLTRPPEDAPWMREP
ncbi:hypothetical protein E7T06_04355 [Deinococcus sp. Arct2-2]|uniref:hypothetical protein n=1 Tax=Deinococcus sp. Arct2-2 TaxID=2568653 RepID=UPI0010A3D3B4|nr:hypothetical protein [Deinococcus sp. Arct2-2]THF71047.1 hypothetical protein E7T06_04355 [Deinococcus sp. Arct2-2]